MIRAFIAVPLPAEVKARLTGAQDEWRRLEAGRIVRWTPAEQIHLTLRFLGDIPDDAVAPLAEALQRACVGVPAFELQARSAGCFPDPRRPRVLWVGITGAVPSLIEMQRRVAAETAAWGERDTREFRAHLTLGRIKEAKPREAVALGAVLLSAAEREFGSWQVTSALLMRSELSPQGARHSVLAEAFLAARR